MVTIVDYGAFLRRRLKSTMALKELIRLGNGACQQVPLHVQIVYRISRNFNESKILVRRNSSNF